MTMIKKEPISDPNNELEAYINDSFVVINPNELWKNRKLNCNLKDYESTTILVTFF